MAFFCISMSSHFLSAHCESSTVLSHASPFSFSPHPPLCFSLVSLTGGSESVQIEFKELGCGLQTHCSPLTASVSNESRTHSAAMLSSEHANATTYLPDSHYEFCTHTMTKVKVRANIPSRWWWRLFFMQQMTQDHFKRRGKRSLINLLSLEC